MSQEHNQIRFYSNSSNYYQFSNFYKTNFSINNYQIKSAEHLFQALKTTNLEDFVYILTLNSPLMAKRKGRKVILRDNWEIIKNDLMEWVLYQKFSNDDILKEMLIETNQMILVEYSPRDKYWGGRGSGKNMMGKALMKIREMVRNNESDDRSLSDVVAFHYT